MVAVSKPHRDEWMDGVTAADTANPDLALTDDTQVHVFESGEIQIDLKRNDNESFAVESDRDMIESFVKQLEDAIEKSKEFAETEKGDA